MYVECNTNSGKTKLVLKESLIFRPSVYSIIVHEGKVLMLEKKDRITLYASGGGVNPGELLEDALKREVIEETGIQIKIDRFLSFKEDFFYNELTKKAYHKLLFYYLCSPLSFDLNQCEEIDEGVPRWFDLEELRSTGERLGKFSRNIFQLI